MDLRTCPLCGKPGISAFHRVMRNNWAGIPCQSCGAEFRRRRSLSITVTVIAGLLALPIVLYAQQIGAWFWLGVAAVTLVILCGNTVIPLETRSDGHED